MENRSSEKQRKESLCRVRMDYAYYLFRLYSPEDVLLVRELSALGNTIFPSEFTDVW